MPMPKTSSMTESVVVSVYNWASRGGEKPTADSVFKTVKSMLGVKGPSLRKTQEILKEHRAYVDIIMASPEIGVLTNGWPTDPDDIYYMNQLDYLRYTHRYEFDDLNPDTNFRWTAETIEVALQLKGILGWPKDFSKGLWYLPDPFGGDREMVGELAVISEISFRRAIAGKTGYPILFDDLHQLLQLTSPIHRDAYKDAYKGTGIKEPHPLEGDNGFEFGPHISLHYEGYTNASPPYLRVLVDGVSSITNLNSYHQLRHIYRLIIEFDEVNDERLNIFYNWAYKIDDGSNAGLSLGEDKDSLIKWEKEYLARLETLWRMAAPEYRRIMNEWSDLIPEADFWHQYTGQNYDDIDLPSFTTYIKACTQWLYTSWNTVFSGEPNVSPYEEPDFNAWSKPDEWVYEGEVGTHGGRGEAPPWADNKLQVGPEANTNPF